MKAGSTSEAAAAAAVCISLSSRSFAIVPTEQPEMETRDRDGQTRHDRENDATKCGGSERARRGVFAAGSHREALRSGVQYLSRSL